MNTFFTELIWVAASEKGVLINFTKFTRKYLHQSLFLIKLLAFLIKSHLFLKSTFGGCFFNNKYSNTDAKKTVINLGQNHSHKKRTSVSYDYDKRFVDFFTF